MTSRAARRRVWFITGSSTGLGRALSEAVLACGDNLVGTTRHPERLQDLAHMYPAQFLPLAVDVTHQGLVQAAVNQAITQFGYIDVLVHVAGSGLSEVMEEGNAAEALHEFKATIFGTLHVTRAVLPFMRDQQRGHIFMGSSAGGVANPIGFGLYTEGTFAIEGVAEALAREVVPLGVRLTIIEQGDFRANRTRYSLVWAHSKMVRHLQRDGNSLDELAPAVQAIMKIVDLAQPSPRLVLGADSLNRL